MPLRHTRSAKSSSPRSSSRPLRHFISPMMGASAWAHVSKSALLQRNLSSLSEETMVKRYSSSLLLISFRKALAPSH